MKLKAISPMLKPCPFCGGEPQLMTGGPGNWFVRCLACNCSTDDVQSERAINLWNTRKPEYEDNK